MSNLEQVIHGLVKPLVVTGAYKDESAALKEILLMMLDKKLAGFRKLIEENTGRFGAFTDYSENIKGRASIGDEKTWLEWKSAIEQEKVWQEARQELIKCDA